MTAFAAAAFHNLMLRRGASTASAAAPCAEPEADHAETMPMLFRSEGFAEDLCDSHWFSGVERRQPTLS